MLKRLLGTGGVLPIKLFDAEVLIKLDGVIVLFISAFVYNLRMSLAVYSNPVGPDLDWCVRKLKFKEPFPHNSRLNAKIAELAKRIIYFVAALLLIPFVATNYWVTGYFMERAGRRSISTQQKLPKSDELLTQAELEKSPAHRIIDQSEGPFKEGKKTVVLLSDIHCNKNYEKRNSHFINEWVRDSDLILTEIVNKEEDLSGSSIQSLLQLTPHVSLKKKFKIKGWDSKSKFLLSRFLYDEVYPALELVGRTHKVVLKKITSDHKTKELVSCLFSIINKINQEIDGFCAETDFNQILYPRLELQGLLSDLNCKLRNITSLGAKFVDEPPEVLTKYVIDAKGVCAKLESEGWRQVIKERSKRNKSLVESLQSAVSSVDLDQRIFLVAGKAHILKCCDSMIKLDVDLKDAHVCGVELAPYIREFIEKDCKPKNVEWIVLDVDAAS